MTAEYYENKALKYKIKYLELKRELDGGNLFGSSKKQKEEANNISDKLKKHLEEYDTSNNKDIIVQEVGKLLKKNEYKFINESELIKNNPKMKEMLKEAKDLIKSSKPKNSSLMSNSNWVSPNFSMSLPSISLM